MDVDDDPILRRAVPSRDFRRAPFTIELVPWYVYCTISYVVHCMDAIFGSLWERLERRNLTLYFQTQHCLFTQYVHWITDTFSERVTMRETESPEPKQHNKELKTTCKSNKISRRPPKSPGKGRGRDTYILNASPISDILL